MTAAEKLSWITESIAAGKTVYVQTVYVTMTATPKTAAKFAKAGCDLFKIKGESLYMSRGKGYDCIDYCGITVH